MGNQKQIKIILNRLSMYIVIFTIVIFIHEMLTLATVYLDIGGIKLFELLQSSLSIIYVFIMGFICFSIILLQQYIALKISHISPDLKKQFRNIFISLLFVNASLIYYGIMQHYTMFTCRFSHPAISPISVILVLVSVGIFVYTTKSIVYTPKP